MKLSTKQKQLLHLKYGNWAVVTGASSGIGFELASLLAGAGFNLVINSSNAQRLHAVERLLKKIAVVEIIPVVADIAEPEGVKAIIKACSGLQVGLLIASAGYGTSGNFVHSAIHTEVNMLKVNCIGLLSLTHYFTQQFIQQQKGGIILMSSIVAFQGVPYSANYAGTKAYVQTLAEGLAAELKPHGVDVLAAAPGPVASGFAQRANMKMNLYLTPAQIGVPILKALGKQQTVFPGRLTKLLVYALAFVPRWGKIKIMQKVMKGMTKHQINAVT
jgi:uncharacterized protein